MSHAPRGWFNGGKDQPPYWDGWVWTGPFQLINEHTACAPVVLLSVASFDDGGVAVCEDVLS